MVLRYGAGAGLSTMQSPDSICERPDMTDPLSEVITLLQPRAVFSRRISGAGRWGVRYSAFGQPSFCAVREGRCRLTVDGHVPLTLEAGGFVLLPATPGFTMSGFEPARFERLDPRVTSKIMGEVRHGTARWTPRRSDSSAAGSPSTRRTSVIAGVIAAVARTRARCRAALRHWCALSAKKRPSRGSGRDLVLTRLVEVLLIEALRLTPGDDAPPGLLRGLADMQLAPAIRQMH